MTRQTWMRGALGLGLALSGLLAPLAQAQVLPNYSGPATRGPDAVPGVVFENGRYCLKLCPDDHVPCDPIDFKRADLRCSVTDR